MPTFFTPLVETEFTVTDQDRGRKSVELWMRSFAPAAAGPNHERALTLLEELETRESVGSVSVHVWGAAFERSDRRRVPQLERIARRLDAFETWATRTGRDLEPFFRTRHVESAFTGDSATVCRLPTLALAEYRDGTLAHVAPSCDGDRTVAVLDRLESLLRGETDESMLTYGEDTSTASSGRRTEDDRRHLESSP